MPAGWEFAAMIAGGGAVLALMCLCHSLWESGCCLALSLAFLADGWIDQKLLEALVAVLRLSGPWGAESLFVKDS